MIEMENINLIKEIAKDIELIKKRIETQGEKRWLNIKEASNYLGYSQDHLHKLKNSYLIEGKHYFKKAGKLLFDKIALDAWVQSSISISDPKEIAKSILKDLI